VQDSTYTVEKYNIDTGEQSQLTIKKDVNYIKFTQNFENDMLIVLRKK